MKDWYELDKPEIIDTPALLIFPERVRRNIRKAIEMTASAERLRPHVKTHKMSGVARMMLEEGITKYKCATIAEAEMLATVGAPDVLLAYQPVGAKVQRLLKLAEKFPDTIFSCVADNITALEFIGETFSVADRVIDVYIDLNVGMNRTGILPGSEALELYRTGKHVAGIRWRGLHAYDGHQRDPDFQKRTNSTIEAFEPVLALRNSIESEFGKKLDLVAGGSPSFPIHASQPDRECSPGTFVFWDLGYAQLCAEQEFEQAAIVLSRVISLPTDNRVCTDLGHKSVAAENEIGRRVLFLNAPEWKAVGQSEEHLLLESAAGERLPIGTVLYGVPYHVCPTIALYERAKLATDHTITGEWRVEARDKKITI